MPQVLLVGTTNRGENDVENMAATLASIYPGANITTLTGKSATTKNIIKAMKKCNMFYYTGNGASSKLK